MTNQSLEAGQLFDKVEPSNPRLKAALLRGQEALCWGA
jgi:hypothetical protein